MNTAFELIVLGCSGGPREQNLSGYLLSPVDHDEWVCLDAGSLLVGIDHALREGHFSSSIFEHNDLCKAGEILRHKIKGYLISHAHLDHIAGLVLNSPEDLDKTIYGLDPTIDNLRDHIFNGLIWPNYGDEGVEPRLARYHYCRLPLHKACPLEKTPMSVESYLLSHPRGYPSTAFLVEHEERYILYFGDTSSDKLEVEKHLARVWKRIAPLILEQRLHAILLECSFPHHDADQAFFGHLDSKLFMGELHNLASHTGTSLEGLNVIVTHRKGTLRAGKDTRAQIQEELEKINDLDCELIFPVWGDKIVL